MKNGLARLDSALWPEPVLAPGANTEAESLDHHFEHALCSELRRGGRVLTIAAAIALGWAALVPLSGAVIIAGQLVLHSNVKKVQHPTGGLVGELDVHDGDHVNAGDVLVRLDATQTQANLAVFSKSLDELNARMGRLEAEKSSASSISFSDELLARETSDPVVAHLLEGERKLFDLR
ncbi:MAG: biotin/lipoyl-binding protein, partial [Rhodomicrobium sp.]